MCIPLLSVFLSKKKKRTEKKNEQQNKHTEELHRHRNRTKNLSITSLAFYHCTDAYDEELLPKESP